MEMQELTIVPAIVDGVIQWIAKYKDTDGKWVYYTGPLNKGTVINSPKKDS